MERILTPNSISKKKKERKRRLEIDNQGVIPQQSASASMRGGLEGAE